MSELETRVKALVADKFGVDPSKVDSGASFSKDFGADSLDLVELVMAFEEEFDVEIPDEDAAKINNVEEVVAYIKARSE